MLKIAYTLACLLLLQLLTINHIFIYYNLHQLHRPIVALELVSIPLVKIVKIVQSEVDCNFIPSHHNGLHDDDV